MEYVIHTSTTILGVVEADNANLASIKSRKYTTESVVNIIQLEDFKVQGSEERRSLNLARRRCYENKVKNLQQQARHLEEQVLQTRAMLQQLELEAQEQRQEECKTCNGKGWIPTFSTEIPKEASDACPDCTNQRRKE